MEAETFYLLSGVGVGWVIGMIWGAYVLPGPDNYYKSKLLLILCIFICGLIGHLIGQLLTGQLSL
jgi:hypothetical protein